MNRPSGYRRDTVSRPTLAVIAACACALVVACTAPDEPADPNAAEKMDIPTAATLGDQETRTVADYLASEPWVSADTDRGARLALMCGACHTFGAGEPALLGPNLHGVFGRRAGSREDYDYSPALRDANFVWTPRALDAWLNRPAQFLPGNRMSFTGVGDADDRAALIAWLLHETGNLH